MIVAEFSPLYTAYIAYTAYITYMVAEYWQSISAVFLLPRRTCVLLAMTNFYSSVILSVSEGYE